MSDQLKVKEETIKLLRATLVPSQKTGLTVRQCEQEYRGLTGSVLPYRKLGYSTAEDMFRDMHDVVRISFDQGQMVVRARETEETEHLHRLVERQSMSNKDKKVLQRRKLQARRQPSNFSTMQYSYPTRISSFTSAQSRFPPRSQHPSIRTYQNSSVQSVTKPAVPPPSMATVAQGLPAPASPRTPQKTAMQIVRGKVREVLMSYPSGLIGSSFEKAFIRRFGQSIQCRTYGFSSCLEMLRSMTDLVNIEDLPSGGYRLHCRSGLRKTREHAASLHTDVPHRERSQSGPSEGNESFNSDDLPLIDEGNISEELRSRIQYTLSKKPDGIWAARFGTEFKVATGSELPVKQLGFLSVIELISSPELSKIVRIKRPTQRDWLIFDARSDNVQEISSSSQAEKQKAVTAPRTNTAPPIPEQFKGKLHHVLCSQHEGVLLSNLPQTYWDIIGEPLNHQNLGFATLEDLVLELTDVVSLHYGGEGSAQLFLRPVEREEPSNIPIYRKVVGDSRQHEIPPDAVGPGVAYVQVGLPVDQVGNYIEVFVSNVITPDNIWLQQRGVHTTDALEGLMDQLEDIYYGKQGDSYKMPDSLVAIGQICVAIFPEDSNWHRVTITGIRDSSFVDVFYVDYGSSCAVPRGQLRLLRNRFIKLPAQSVPATLANVRPSGKEWTRSARDSLLQMCSSKPLIALVSHISQERVMSVCLCDTSGAEDVHINDVLVQQGHATFTCADSDPPAINDVSDSTEKSEPEPASTRSSTPELTLKPELPMMATDLEKEMLAAVSHSKDAFLADSSAENSSQRRHIKFAQLTEDHSIHIICLDNLGYAVSAEVSGLIWPQKDLLRTMLRLKHNMPKLVISAEDRPEIFKEFEKHEVRGTINGDQQKTKSCVTIYELHVVCDILEIFKDTTEEVRNAMKKQAELFDPNDPYWQGSSSGDDIYLLKQKLPILQTRRKELLQLLVDDKQDAQGSQRYVDELEKVEDKLRFMRTQLEFLQSHQKELAAVHDSSDDVKTSIAGKGLGSQKNMGEATKFFCATSSSSGQTKTNPVAPMPQVPASDPSAMLNAVFSSFGLNGSSGDAAAGQQQSTQQFPMQQFMNINPAPAASSVPNVSTSTAGSGTVENQASLNLLAYMASLSSGAGNLPPAGRGLGMVDPSYMMRALSPDHQQLLNKYRLFLATNPAAASLHIPGAQMNNPMCVAPQLHPPTPMNPAPLGMMGAQGLPGMPVGGMEAFTGMYAMQMPAVNNNILFGQGRGRVSSTAQTPGGLQGMQPFQH